MSRVYLPDQTAARGAGEPTSNVRHFVVLAAMLMAVLLYLDRFCVGMAEPYIKQDLRLSTFQIGIFFSAFFLTYALCQVPSGWLSDRFGSRLMLTIYIVTWSFFTAMMGLSVGFGMLLLMRAAYGVGQAGAYPTSASILSKWVPFSMRGTASSIVAFGGRLGGAIAPVLTAFLIVLLVPTEKSSLLDEPELLLDGPSLCIKLNPTEHSKTSPALGRVRQFLPQSVIQRVDTISEAYRPLDEKRQSLEKEAEQLQRQWRLIAAWKKSNQAENISFDFEAEDRQRFVDALNQIVRSNDFFEPGVFDGLKNLDRAAIGYLKRIDRDEQLTQAETERFNRLLLEGCFPDELGKVYVAGWRPVMIAYGAVGLFVAAVFCFVVRNRPEEHPRCNQAEIKLIAVGRLADAPGPHGKAGNVPWSRLLRSRSMWFNCFGQVGTNIGWVFLVTWFPRYLIEVHEVPILERGEMASIPLFAGWLGMLGGGRLTDYLVRRVGLRWGRRIPWSFSRFIGMSAFLACPFLENPWAVTGALAIVAVSTDLGTASGWAYCQDVGGRYVGSILGWGNMWGNLGATVSPILLVWVVETFSWQAMFFVCAAAYLAAGLFALGIDATIPIAPPEEEDGNEAG